MACNFNNSFLDISLDKVTFFNNYFFRDLYMDCLLLTVRDCIWFLTVTVLFNVNRFLYYYLNRHSHLRLLDHWLFHLNKLYLFLYNDMMDRFLNNFELSLLIDLRD